MRDSAMVCRAGQCSSHTAAEAGVNTNHRKYCHYELSFTYERSDASTARRKRELLPSQRPYKVPVGLLQRARKDNAITIIRHRARCDHNTRVDLLSGLMNDPIYACSSHFTLRNTSLPGRTGPPHKLDIAMTLQALSSCTLSFLFSVSFCFFLFICGSSRVPAYRDAAFFA